MNILFNKAKFRIQIFVEVPQIDEHPIESILHRFQEAGYACKLARHKTGCSKSGINLGDYPEEIFPEAKFDKTGEFTGYTGRIGYFINMEGGYYYMPSKKDPSVTRFKALESWIAKLNQKRKELEAEDVEVTPIITKTSEPAVTV